MGGAIERVVERLTGSGAVSVRRIGARSHRAGTARLFREYFAMYAREQAYCIQPGADRNLESHWHAKNRRLD